MRKAVWIRAIAGSTALAMLLAGCTTINPYTGETQVSDVTKGAAIGAAAGAAIGAVSGKRNRGQRAIIGAGIGALAGGSVGYYMDTQEAKLRQQLAGTGVSVTRSGNNIVLNMPGNITFEVDRSEIRPDFFSVLTSVGLVLKEYEKTLVEVAGHTDNTGADAYNQQLSEKRAQAVASYLQAQGVQPVRFLVVGYGETRPIANNSTPEGRSQNRRVEITLVPVTNG
jgi:outer membrane protein OmpA-like peptidoglycan-associated protein